MNSAPPLSPAWLPLRNAQQFQAVLQQGQVVARSTHFVLHALRWPACDKAVPTTQAQPLLLFAAGRQAYTGTIIPKRWARRAVTRNLIKRQIRSLIAKHAPVINSQIPDSIAIAIRLRSAFSTQHFISAASPMLRAAVRTELCELLSRPCWASLPALPAPPHKTALRKKTQRQTTVQHMAAPSGTMPVLP